MTQAIESELLPWLMPQWQQYQQSRQAGRMPHALLFHGQSGVGKQRFAQLLAQSLLCEQSLSDGLPCNACRACRLYRAGTHADFRCIEREEDSRQLKIAQIRDLNEYMVLSRQAGEYKVALVPNAEAMNRNAANSLLKTLEEPPAGAVIILVTSQMASLPATIRSRCHKIRFSVPASQVAEDWLSRNTRYAGLTEVLSLAQGEPLTALAMIEQGLIDERKSFFKAFIDMLNNRQTVVEVASQWKSFNPQYLQDWLLSWLMDAIRLNSGISPEGLENPDLHRSLSALATRVELPSLYMLYDKLLNIRRMSGIPLNTQLLLEDSLLGWRSLMLNTGHRV